MTRFGRRGFLVATCALLVSPLARTQDRLRRVGCLFGGSPKTHSRALDAFRLGLKEHGWVEGHNVSLEMFWAEGRMDRVPSLALELVRSRPDVILTAANPIVAEVKKATQSIPIVMATGADPVESGLVASLARPGGNLTGLAGFYESTPVKMLELAGAFVARGAYVAMVVEKNTVFSRAHHREALMHAAKTLDLRIEVHDVVTEEDVVRVLDALAKSKPVALVVLPGPMVFARGSELVRHTGRLSIPVIYPFEEMAEAGGLVSYASSLSDNYRRAARYVDRIFRGANPGELPIEQPTRLWLAVNLRTAKAQNIRIPQSILHRADRVIE
jgi:putative tryptophan/tyrosine transport system substrate-binding protein